MNQLTNLHMMLSKSQGCMVDPVTSSEGDTYLLTHAQAIVYQVLRKGIQVYSALQLGKHI